MFIVDKPLALAIALGSLAAIVNVVLIVFVVLRRARRSHYFMLKDQARAQLAGTVRDACGGSVEALCALKAYRDGATRDAIEELLLASINPATHEAVAHVVGELDYVAQWTRQAFSRDYRGGAWLSRATSTIRKSRVFAVRRAIAVGQLGYLHPSIAAPLMIRALRDPSPLVISVAADSLAHSGSATGLQPLLELLRRAINEENVAPERGAKAALVMLRPDPADLVTAYSSTGSKRFRMAMLDVLHRSHCGSNVEQKLSHCALVEALRDPDAEIRARAVRLIPILEVESDATAAALTDESPLVRMRAVDVALSSDLEVLAQVHDERWRVREAATGVLWSGSGVNRQQLLDKLLSTQDVYAAEQIMERLQLNGELRSCITRLNQQSAFYDRLVCRKAVALGMDSMLIDALQPHAPESLLINLLEITHDSRHPSRPSRLATLANRSSERVRAVAGKQLQQFESTRAEAVGAA
jgi:HEAT repeat protein